MLDPKVIFLEVEQILYILCLSKLLEKKKKETKIRTISSSNLVQAKLIPPPLQPKIFVSALVNIYLMTLTTVEVMMIFCL